MLNKKLIIIIAVALLSVLSVVSVSAETIDTSTFISHYDSYEVISEKYPDMGSVTVSSDYIRVLWQMFNIGDDFRLKFLFPDGLFTLNDKASKYNVDFNYSIDFSSSFYESSKYSFRVLVNFLDSNGRIITSLVDIQDMDINFSGSSGSFVTETFNFSFHGEIPASDVPDGVYTVYIDYIPLFDYTSISTSLTLNVFDFTVTYADSAQAIIDYWNGLPVPNYKDQIEQNKQDIQDAKDKEDEVINEYGGTESVDNLLGQLNDFNLAGIAGTGTFIISCFNYFFGNVIPTDFRFLIFYSAVIGLIAVFLGFGIRYLSFSSEKPVSHTSKLSDDELRRYL